MPIHDWSRVDAGIFHAMHHGWIHEISLALNRGVLPQGYYALPEQVAGGVGPDVLTLQHPSDQATPIPTGGVALVDAPPRVRFRYRPEQHRYHLRAKTVTVRHVSNHRVTAMVEIVSPRNKGSQNGLNSFVRKAREMLAAGIHLLVMDLFPPTDRDPSGIHRAIWGLDENDETVLPPEQPLQCVSYVGGNAPEFFGEPFAVGDPLPDMPLFLTPDVYVNVGLEATYNSAFEVMPHYWQDVVMGGDENP